MKFVYPFEFENKAKIYFYAADVSSHYSLAVYHMVEEMLEKTDKMIDQNIESMGDEQLRYFSVRAKTLRDILNLPEVAQQKLNEMKEE